jgi:hypothetical protein
MHGIFGQLPSEDVYTRAMYTAELHKTLLGRRCLGCIPTTIELGDLGIWATSTKTTVWKNTILTRAAIQASKKGI